MRKALEEAGPLCWRVGKGYTLADTSLWDNFCASYVMPALAPSTFYGEWLLKAQGHNVDHASMKESGRTAWLRAMIAAAECGEDLPATPSLPPELEGRHG
jgi:hypothetical protein